MKINQHVIKWEQGWAVVGEGNSRDTAVLPTREAAVERARRIALNQGSELIVHVNDRQIMEKGSDGTWTREQGQRPRALKRRPQPKPEDLDENGTKGCLHLLQRRRP
jgi:hypothetical protein